MAVASEMISTANKEQAEQQGGEYNRIYRYSWRTYTNSLPMHVMQMINKITEGRRWGWSFIAHENMDYRREDWYKDQTLVLSFENEFDLIQSKLEVAHLL